MNALYRIRCPAAATWASPTAANAVGGIGVAAVSRTEPFGPATQRHACCSLRVCDHQTLLPSTW